MRNFLNGLLLDLRSDNRGMELVQVAILIAIAVVIGLIFNKQIKTNPGPINDTTLSCNFLSRLFDISYSPGLFINNPGASKVPGALFRYSIRDY